MPAPEFRSGFEDGEAIEPRALQDNPCMRLDEGPFHALRAPLRMDVVRTLAAPPVHAVEMQPAVTLPESQPVRRRGWMQGAGIRLRAHDRERRHCARLAAWLSSLRRACRTDACPASRGIGSNRRLRLARRIAD